MVKIFENLSGLWTQKGQDLNEGGHSISLNSDGSIVACGNPGDYINGTDPCYVRVFNVSTLSNCVEGCTDSLALNYDATAITDDGSCLYCDLTNTMIVSQNTPGNCDGIILSIPSTTHLPISYLWSTGSTSNNITGLCAGVYSVVITDDIGCTIEDTVYMNVISGCMDSLASNYNSLATYDDGSCIYCVYGCMDSLALNYDALATCDDGSCQYQSNCTSPKPDGLYAYDVIDIRAKIGWNNMNDSACMVLEILC